VRITKFFSRCDVSQLQRELDVRAQAKESIVIVSKQLQNTPLTRVLAGVESSARIERLAVGSWAG
jgi:hypothetical protein